MRRSADGSLLRGQSGDDGRRETGIGPGTLWLVELVDRIRLRATVQTMGQTARHVKCWKGKQIRDAVSRVHRKVDITDEARVQRLRRTLPVVCTGTSTGSKVSIDCQAVRSRRWQNGSCPPPLPVNLPVPPSPYPCPCPCPCNLPPVEPEHRHYPGPVMGLTGLVLSARFTGS